MALCQALIRLTESLITFRLPCILSNTRYLILARYFHIGIPRMMWTNPLSFLIDLEITTNKLPDRPNKFPFLLSIQLINLTTSIRWQIQLWIDIWQRDFWAHIIRLIIRWFPHFLSLAALIIPTWNGYRVSIDWIFPIDLNGTSGLFRYFFWSADV